MELIEGLVTGGLFYWLFRRAKAKQQQKPLPLLRIPLTGSEMSNQCGILPAYERRLGDFPEDIQRRVLAAYLLDGKPVAPEVLPDVFFKAGEPQTFEEYGGQQHITAYLRACMDGLGSDERAIDNQCFEGPAGSGKTLLAKVTANELRQRQPQTDFIEVFTTDVPNATALDRLMRRIQAAPGCVIFIDELHTLEGKEHWTKFLEVLENKRYQFEGEAHPVSLPPFTILGATTDFGTLTEPWRRRFEPHRMNPASYDEILSYVMNRDYPIAEATARLIVDRVHWGGVPWEALAIFRAAKVFARARHSPAIEPADVEHVWTVNGIDEFGLRPVDRDVMRALFSQPRSRRDRRTGEQEFVCYASSEENTAQMARVDLAEYRKYIRPKLMRRGLLEIRITYGQALTPLAVERYGFLRTGYVGGDAGNIGLPSNAGAAAP